MDRPSSTDDPFSLAKRSWIDLTWTLWEEPVQDNTEPNLRRHGRSWDLLAKSLVYFLRSIDITGFNFIKAACPSQQGPHLMYFSFITGFNFIETARPYSKGTASLDLVFYEMRQRRCTVFPRKPWGYREERSIEDIETAKEKLNFTSGCFILSGIGGKIVNISIVSDDEKLYLVDCSPM
ncbi:unnamed protein product [Fraxinus pennsylvanica]|uniref:Uncharacterized protein n=1 Tax=Fraxinus pennsylvanica TaxID=56036 RepID=A0AAD2ABG0_9LAMI|nr:unnamed protein product [Fraxinus pennsylvanica]